MVVLPSVGGSLRGARPGSHGPVRRPGRRGRRARPCARCDIPSSSPATPRSWRCRAAASPWRRASLERSTLPLDVIIVRKLGAPGRPELAMGAIGEGGIRVLEHDVLRTWHVSDAQLATVEAREQAELARRAARLRAGRARVSLHDRPVIVVDDGLATGSTARAAIRVARAAGATLGGARGAGGTADDGDRAGPGRRRRGVRGDALAVLGHRPVVSRLLADHRRRGRAHPRRGQGFDARWPVRATTSRPGPPLLGARRPTPRPRRRPARPRSRRRRRGARRGRSRPRGTRSSAPAPARGRATRAASAA